MRYAIGPVYSYYWMTLNIDIVCVQETWYTKQDLEQLNNLHPAYHGTGAATIDNSRLFISRSPREGCPSYGGSNLTGSLTH